MALPGFIRDALALPAVCAPMATVSGPELALAACKAGLMAGLPTHNASGVEELTQWLADITAELDRLREIEPSRKPGLLAVNMSGRRTSAEIDAYLAACKRFGIRVIISAMGDPTEMIRRAHDQGAVVFHDVVSLRHAEKAIAADVDGLICVGHGGGGHSGALNPLVFLPAVRAMFDGVLVLAGAAATGAAVRSAEVLGADLCYLGTRFIASREARAPDAYKAMLVEAKISDLLFTPNVTGVPSNWLKPSLARVGLDPDNLPVPAGPRDYGHLPPGKLPWRDLWSGGQSVELIHDAPSVEELVARLKAEYAAACAVPPFGAAGGPA